MSTLCNDCTVRNPAIPVYSKAVPVGDICSSCGGTTNLLFPPSGGAAAGKTTEVLAGFSMSVEDLSDTLVDRFRVNWAQILQLTANLALIAKSGVVTKANPVLWGTTIDEINMTWTYNRELDVETQTLVNTAGLTPPTLVKADRLYDYTSGVSIKNSDESFTLTGDTENGLPESTGSDVEWVVFGNYVLHGVGANAQGGADTILISLIESFIPGGATIATTKAGSFFALSVVLERDFYAIPKRFGFATFSKNGGSGNGGLKRMKNVSGTIQAALDQYGLDGDETAISINNGLEAEEYYIYMSVYDNIADPLNPITVT